MAKDSEKDAPSKSEQAGEAKSQFKSVERVKTRKEEKVKENVAAITNIAETDGGHVGDADEAALDNAKGKEHKGAQSSLTAKKNPKGMTGGEEAAEPKKKEA
jgi:hypothetical protein